MTEKKNQTPFKTVSKNLPFWPDLTQEKHEPFTGIIEGSTNLGDSPNEADQIPVYIAVDIETGEEKFIVQSYAIKKAVEAAKKEYGKLSDNIVFNFDFIGKTVVKGKPFNQFNTGYCTLEEYELFKKPAPAVKKK